MCLGFHENIPMRLMISWKLSKKLILAFIIYAGLTGRTNTLFNIMTQGMAWTYLSFDLSDAQKILQANSRKFSSDNLLRYREETITILRLLSLEFRFGKLKTKGERKLSPSDEKSNSLPAWVGNKLLLIIKIHSAKLNKVNSVTCVILV